MKIQFAIIFLFRTLITLGSPGQGPTSPPTEIEVLMLQLATEMKDIQQKYDLLTEQIHQDLQVMRSNLTANLSKRNQIEYLVKKDVLNWQLDSLRLKEQSDISKIRYIKGLEIIRLLYDKTLSLDHHFSSVTTLNEIHKISNPNHYGEFRKVKELLIDKRDKKHGFDLTKILGDNVYASITHSLISLFNNNSASKAEKESELKQMECILDFTLSVHNDLNTIYFETVFLQKSNENVMKAVQQLFVDFTKPIGYGRSLSDCRNSDDWGSVREHLNRYIIELDRALQNPTDKREVLKLQINLEFPIDRLLQFITEYNAFIDQGAKFYEKFEIMLNSYPNEQQCQTVIPIAYNKLRESIGIAIDKFNTAYKPVEINGSKMKEILYGINEYD
ncbi:MAG: hypothetical protein AAFP76_08965 [Bacteroidota bacterium]